MAVKTKADVLVQLNLVVASLNSIIADTVSGQAEPTKDPRHPLRQLTKLISYGNTGVFTVNSTYLDQVYNVAGTDVTNNVATGSRNLKKKIA